MTTLWICGQVTNYDPEDKAWQFNGVYSTEQKAINACLTDLYFIGPAVLDSGLPDETVEWSGAYYPKGTL